jgi:hypothetical protein
MTTILYSFIAITIAILLGIILFADKIEKSHKEMCEQWRKEQIEAGMPEKFVDLELLSNHFIL